MHPVRAYGSGSRMWRKDVGEIFDNFNIVYEYPNGVTSNNTCTQIDGVRGDVTETIRGSKGTFTTTAGKGGTGIEGIRKRGDTETPMIYQYEGPPDLHYDQEAQTFVESVLGAGEHRDDTKYGMESTLTAIMGREAAYRKEIIEWDKFWKSNDRLSFRPDMVRMQR
ncbi:MAG: hypothetical protein ACREEM_44855 [Blastocatellia bacterium]